MMRPPDGATSASGRLARSTLRCGERSVGASSRWKRPMCPPGSPTAAREGSAPRAVPRAQVAGGVRLRRCPRTQTRPDRPPGHPRLRRQAQRRVPRPAPHRQDPPSHGIARLAAPTRPGTESCSQPPPNGSTGSSTPTTPGACKPSCAGCAAARYWSSTRSATSRSSTNPRTCSSSSCPPARNEPRRSYLQQGVRPLGRLLRRRDRRRRRD